MNIFHDNSGVADLFFRFERELPVSVDCSGAHHVLLVTEARGKLLVVKMVP